MTMPRWRFVGRLAQKRHACTRANAAKTMLLKGSTEPQAFASADSRW